MIVVTGGAGFVGGNLVRGLNRRGVRDVLVVDELGAGSKRRNLRDLKISNCVDKDAFLRATQSDKWRGLVSMLLHQGACTDTMATDEKYVIETNFNYSKALYRFCAENQVPFIYASSASVYGAGKVFVEDAQHESALNLYARSKLLFDQFVRQQPAAAFPCVGLRYFNVYGPREQHKGRMASTVWHFLNQYLEDGQVRLFRGSDGYADGEQRRDFISVEDVVRANLFFMDNPAISGIYNIGTGQSRSFNEVAVAVINACRRRQGRAQTSLEQAVGDGEISYIPMPPALRGKYQSYTQANLERLRGAGYSAAFLDIAEGVDRYIGELVEAGVVSFP